MLKNGLKKLNIGNTWYSSDHGGSDILLSWDTIGNEYNTIMGRTAGLAI